MNWMIYVQKSIARCTKAALSMMVMLVMYGATALGQVSTGTLVGTASDSTGAVIANCQVSATSTATGDVHSTLTNGDGVYSLPSLPPGAYKVSVTHAGFATQTVRLEIPIDRTLRQDFTLGVSGAAATIQVNAATSATLETEGHEVAESLPGTEILQLPQTTRDVFGKLDMTPGLQSDAASNDSGDISFFGTGANNVNLGGVQNGNVSYLQDGVLNYNLLTKTANLQPTPEDVEDVDVQANGASARYDEPGVVNVVTKGGSNEFHGMLYDYLQNDDLDAKPYYSTTAPELRYNQFGASLGGPIWKKKLQFFFAYDGTRDHSFATDLEQIPTPAMFQGNFGSTTVIDPLTGTPFANNSIPSGRISSFASQFISWFPTPNGNFRSGAANYASSQGFQNNFDSYLGRLDYALSPKDLMYGAWETTNPAGTHTSWVQPSIFNWENIQTAKNGYVQESHTFSPTLVNVVRFGYNYSDIFVTEAGAGAQNYTQQLGVPEVTPLLSEDLPPVITFDAGGWSSLNGYGNGAAYNPDGAKQSVYAISDELNQVIGKHSIFYGLEADHMYMLGNWVIWNNGEFDFNGQFTTPPGQAPQPGNVIADFLLGYPATSYGGIGYTYGDFDQWNVMPYFEDDWKVNRKLTVNLGIRYDYYQSPVDTFQHAGIFNLATDSVTTGSYSQQYDSIAPRVGAAYALNDKTVIRGGYGIYYTTFLYNELQFMLAHPPNYNLEINSFGVNQPTPIAQSLTPPTGVGDLGTFTTAPSMPAGQVQQWNFAVQRALGTTWSASLTYLGNKAIHLQQRFNANQAALPTDPLNPTPVQSRRPYPNIGDVYEAGDVGWSNYNALQVELVKRFSNGLSLNANYVWSKALDDNSEDNQNPRDGANLALDYGPADFDRAQVFKFSDVWDLPIGPGKLIAQANNWFNREVIGGWQTSEKLIVQTGTPFSVGADVNDNIGADTNEYANNSCGGNVYAANRTNLNWLNTSCFTQPIGTYGNIGRNSIFGPRESTFDASASKYFPIAERVKVKFAADFINAFNHPIWALGGQSVGSPGLGEASDYGTPRVIQMSLHVQF